MVLVIVLMIVQGPSGDEWIREVVLVEPSFGNGELGRGWFWFD